MKKRNTYTGSFKARVIRELLNGNRSLEELARYYQLHPNQIKNWKSILLKHADTILEDKRHK